jgi:hypothetical protein
LPNACRPVKLIPHDIARFHPQGPLSQFTAWCAAHITGDEKGEAQIFLDRLFQAFGHKQPSLPIMKMNHNGGGNSPQRHDGYNVRGLDLNIESSEERIGELLG